MPDWNDCALEGTVIEGSLIGCKGICDPAVGIDGIAPVVW
jgi:hypothetical protein